MENSRPESCAAIAYHPTHPLTRLGKDHWASNNRDGVRTMPL
jgi:hypothetical protein